jgi:signal transduction histidine kinase
MVTTSWPESAGRPAVHPRRPGNLLRLRYERDRIARELHDVIAHSVSIMVIQASAGQRLAPTDPAAGELLANIAELAREATTDISGLTRLLNPALEHPLTQEHLLARTTQTGVQLDFDIVGDVSSIPGHAARATYRILQEGLAGGGPARKVPW